MINIYGIRSCDTCRKARKWLEKHNVEHRYLDIRDDGLDEESLIRWQKTAGWEELLNKRSITWRKIPEFDRAELDAERAYQLILAYPTVMKRPVLDLGASVILGFNESDYIELFSDSAAK